MEKLVYYITYFNRPRSLQRWYRAHPKTTLAGVGVMIIQLGWMWHKILRQDKSALNKRWQKPTPWEQAVIEGELYEWSTNREIVLWYTAHGVHPITTEEKTAFRQRFPQYGSYNDNEIEVLFGLYKEV